MSAVIWFGIVAVWAFVLIPTWVRRGDIHWRRSEQTANGSRDRLGRAARVVSRKARPATMPASSDAARPTSTMTSGIRSATAVGQGEPVRAASPQDTSEAPMPTRAHVPAARSAPRRQPPAARSAGGKKTPAPHVRRARKLVWIASAALATLLLALILGGLWIVLNLIADVALLAYLRRLRGIARQQQEQRRTQRTPRAAKDRATRPAPPRPGTVRSEVGSTVAGEETGRSRSAGPVRRVLRERESEQVATGGPVRKVTRSTPERVATAGPVRKVASEAGSASESVTADPSFIDLSDDAPTQEILAVRAG